MSTGSLTVDDLSAGYGETAVVSGVTMEVQPAQLVALLGPNGAGKSTTLLAISGLAKTFTGTVSVDGTDLTSVPANRRARNGLVQAPEDRSLFPSLSVDENLLLATSGRTRPDEAYEVFPELGELRSRRAGLLSGGEQQMLVVGRALEMNPRYLMVDELSLGLAPSIAQRVFQRLRAVADRGEIGVLVVEQNVDLAFEYADYIYLLANGQIRYHGTNQHAKADWPEFRDAYFS